MRSSAALMFVPLPSQAAEMLEQIVPALIEAEQVAARLKRMMCEQSRELAKERGVGWIRPEAIRAEFGQPTAKE